MNEGDDFLNELNRTDPWIAAITPARIGNALEGFPLTLADGWDMACLANAIQDMANSGRGSPPQSDFEAKAELTKLAEKAITFRREIARMGETSETAAFWEVFRHLRESQKAEATNQDDYNALMLHSLDTIANVLARAASQIGTQPKQVSGWQKKDGKSRRVGFAVALIPIFQDAFDTPARANNWGADYGKEHPWPDFYRRIYCELFPKVVRLNLSEVLQEAARELPNVEAMERYLDEQDATRSENSDE